MRRVDLWDGGSLAALMKAGGRLLTAAGAAGRKAGRANMDDTRLSMKDRRS